MDSDCHFLSEKHALCPDLCDLSRLWSHRYRWAGSDSAAGQRLCGGGYVADSGSPGNYRVDVQRRLPSGVYQRISYALHDGKPRGKLLSSDAYQPRHNHRARGTLSESTDDGLSYAGVNFTDFPLTDPSPEL